MAVHADQLAVGRVHQPRAGWAPRLPMPAAPNIVYVAARRGLNFAQIATRKSSCRQAHGHALHPIRALITLCLLHTI